MKLIETKLKGAYVIQIECLKDDRGFFARCFDEEVFIAHNLNPRIVQCNISFNKRKGTLRGMHYQAAPFQEEKIVRCTSGSIYDVIIDLRKESSTFKNWFSIELSSKNRKALYIPKGFAHGFQTLEDNTEVFYQMSEYYNQDFARGIRWDDPAFGIKFLLPVSAISIQDQSIPDFEYN